MSFHDKRFPGEDPAYRESRNQLLKAEMDLRAQIEQVAKMRRELPPGAPLKEDYTFEEVDKSSASVRQVKFSELFVGNKDSLILYNFMYGPQWKKPCPACTSLLDAWAANAAYVRNRVNLAVVAKAPATKVQEWGNSRDWSSLRLLSSEKNTFKTDYYAEFETQWGDQHPLIMVFVRDGKQIRLSWASELFFAAAQDGNHPRHADLTWPLWNLFDLTPEGRGEDFQLNYER